MVQSPGMYVKRQRMEGAGMMSNIGGHDLMEENEMLKRKITDLQREVLDLRQMNDTLYDQNTRYRNQLRGVATTSLDDQYKKAVSVMSTINSTGGLTGNRNYYDFG